MLKAILLLILSATSVMGQTNLTLKRELDSLFSLYRTTHGFEEMLEMVKPKSDTSSQLLYEAGLSMLDEVKTIRTSLTRHLADITKMHGYPGETMVGTPANETVYEMALGLGLTKTYLPLIKQAANEGEIPYRLYATSLDSYLIDQGKPQRYGTQIRCYPLRSTQIVECFVWPVHRWKRVNSLRRQAGLHATIEEHYKKFKNILLNPRWRVSDVQQRYRVDG